MHVFLTKIFYCILSVLEAAASSKIDCSTFGNCGDCVNTVACDWCTAAYQCTNKVADTCRDDFIVSNAAVSSFEIQFYIYVTLTLHYDDFWISMIQKKTASGRSGADFCPKFTAVDGENEILVPSGSTKSIQAKIQVVGHFLLQKYFLCKFTIDGREFSVKATLLGDQFTCEPVNLKTEAPQTKVKFEILWEKTKALANPNDVHCKWIFQTTVME